MALISIPSTFGKGFAHLTSKLKEILVEVRGLSFDLVSGDSAETNIAVTGIATDDTLAFVLGIDADNGTPADQVKDFTSDMSITSAGNIQGGAGVDTSGYDLVVVWYNKDGS